MEYTLRVYILYNIVDALSIFVGELNELNIVPPKNLSRYTPTFVFTKRNLNVLKR